MSNTKILNKPMFWTGLSFQILQLLIIAIFGLTLLDWSWLNIQTVVLILGAVFVLLFNIISLVLIINSL